MPEIAEVETVRRVLKKQILNKKIVKVDILYDKIIESDINFFKNNIINEEFIDIKRTGKWLIFETNNYYLLSHLRMEGKYFIKKMDEPIAKHEHIIFTFEDNITLRYHDTRKFGKMIFILKKDLNKLEKIKKLGTEPISNDLTINYLKDKLKNKKAPMKSLLLDQTIINGLGNIYADEVLFRAKIHPLKKGENLTDLDIKNLISSSKAIIKRAIELGGTTIKSYTSSLGVTGRFQQELQVHKREGESCFNCNEKIIRIKVGGRSTYFCPNCQKM